MAIKIGTAGWSIPRQVAGEFPAEGSALRRYSARFGVVEINSSFHRPHQHSTWQRWHDSVPAGFRFSVKLPKLITHEQRLVDCSPAVAEFLDQVSPLGDKLAVLLVQLPPKLALEEPAAAAFFHDLRSRTDAAIACEPRHASWFTPQADALLDRMSVARVAADPAICHAAAVPGGSARLKYWRLHGSPVVYRSSYHDRIDVPASKLKAAATADAWCIFDNTASSAAAGDALELMESLESDP